MRHHVFLFAALFSCAVAAGQTIPLEQNWKLLPDPDAKYRLQTLRKDGWRPVRVGISWNAQFDDMRDFGGVGWYRTTIAKFASTHTLLRISACDYFCEVFVNGEEVGEHEGGYTPFEIDITSHLRRDSNELIVKVTDPPRDAKRNQQLFPKFLYDELPHGKQNWYVQTGGLWQPVALRAVPEICISSVHVTPTMAGDVRVDVAAWFPKLAGADSARLLVELFDRDGRTTGGPSESAWPQPVGGNCRADYCLSTASISLHIDAPKLWSPNDPYLYTAKATLTTRATSGETDMVAVRFGFRDLTTRGGKLYLNEKPFYMIGALDQDFYPGTIYTPPSPDYIRDEMRKAKALGLNTLRCHIKVCTPDYLDAADEVGMLIWYEIPSWNDERHWTRQAADRGMQVFREALERDWNHPSLGIQSIINESWGADLSKPEQRKWLASTYDEAKKAVAPLGRLVDDNSACCENFHVKSDLADFHQYYSIPDHAEQWSKWVQEFASRPKWIWSPYGDAQSTGNEPLIVSEFGNWGLPRLSCGEAQSKPSECSLPWWFSRDFNGREITMPAGVVDRFHQYKFDRIFSSYNELAGATQWHQFESLKYEIEQIRAQPNVQGYVITEFTDVNWESNGLMDIWRNPKAYEKELVQIQQPDFVAGSGAGTGNTKVFPKHTVPDVPVALATGLPYEFRVLHNSADAAVVISQKWDQAIEQKLSIGGTVILLADSADALPPNLPVQLKAREASNYNGDWISNFNWILPSSPVFGDIAFNKIMGFEAERVTPNYVLLGLKPEQFDDVLSGAFYGWIHNNSALVLQTKYGKGKLLITTFRFDKYGTDPYATYLLDNMIRYVSSPQFAPKLDLPTH